MRGLNLCPQTLKYSSKSHPGGDHRHEKMRDSSDVTPPCKMLRRSDSPENKHIDSMGHSRAKAVHTHRARDRDGGEMQTYNMVTETWTLETLKIFYFTTQPALCCLMWRSISSVLVSNQTRDRRIDALQKQSTTVTIISFLTSGVNSDVCSELNIVVSVMVTTNLHCLRMNTHMHTLPSFVMCWGKYSVMRKVFLCLVKGLCLHLFSSWSMSLTICQEYFPRSLISRRLLLESCVWGIKGFNLVSDMVL